MQTVFFEIESGSFVRKQSYSLIKKFPHYCPVFSYLSHRHTNDELLSSNNTSAKPWKMPAPKVPMTTVWSISDKICNGNSSSFSASSLKCFSTAKRRTFAQVVMKGGGWFQATPFSTPPQKKVVKSSQVTR